MYLVRERKENEMKVYVVREFIDYYNADIVKIFSKESDARDYVKKHYWEDDGADGIWYEEHELE